MTGRILIYGANGYTGKLTARAAKEAGLSPVLAGRNEALVKSIADIHLFESRAFSLDNPETIDHNLRDIAAVLHMAGPFSATAKPMAEACLRTGTHYLDITGEISVFEMLKAMDAAAKRAGIMMLPGCGFDVVPSDCLLAHVQSRLPTANKLVLAMSGLGEPSRGTAKTALESIGQGTLIRRDGRIEAMSRPPRREFDFGEGLERCIGVSWGDVSTGFHSTGVPNIQVFFASTPMLERMAGMGALGRWFMTRGFMKRRMERYVDKTFEGPSREQREAGRIFMIAQAVEKSGRMVESRLETPEGYLLTARVASDIASRVADGAFTPGFQTPSKFLGKDYIVQVEGTKRTDL